MALMRLLVILGPNHKKAWHQAPTEQGLFTAPARLGGWGRNRLCWAAVIMAPATRGQQVPTGSLPKGPEPHLDLNPPDLPAGLTLLVGDAIYGEKWKPQLQAPQLGK